MDFDSLVPDATPVDSSSTQAPSNIIGAPAVPQSFDSLVDDREAHGSGLEEAKTFGEGALQGVLGPAAPIAEQAFMQGLGQTPEETQANILGRQNTNPYWHAAGEMTGLAGSMLTGTGEGALVAKAGEAVSKGVAGEASTLAAKLGSSAVKGAVENALISGSDETSKLLLNDPNTSAETALIDTGLSGAIGGVLGGALGSVSPLWEAAAGSKVGQIAADFRGRMAEILKTPDPVSAMTDELTELHGAIKDAPVFGTEGLKADAIAKLMPEMSDNIATQVSENIGKVQKSIDKLGEDPLAKKLQGALDEFKVSAAPEYDPITGEATHEVNSQQIFDATDKLKRQLQEWSKFDKGLRPIAEQDFVSAAKGLSHDLRMSLEDSDVWGKAADVQRDVNKAFSEYLKPLKDFENKFTSKVTGVPEIDPGKINTFINQAGKPNAEIKQEMLKNFMNATENYKNSISNTYSKIGLESPLKPSPLNVTMQYLNEPTAGARMADGMFKEGIAKGLGATAGGVLGHAVGAPGIGAYLGGDLLSPYIQKILPGIAKFVMGTESSGTGFKAASDYAMSVMRGENALTKATKSIFTAGKEVLPQGALPDTRGREKLDKSIKSIPINPQRLLDNDSHLGHYMANHAGALGTTAANGTQYLNSLRPSVDKATPLDSRPVINGVQKASYNNALDIANKPLIVLNKIKTGNVTPDDIKHLRNLYPNLYTRMASKLTSEMIEHVNKNELIPYKTRIGLSMFLGTPLDSTMTPQGIMAAQPKPTPSPQQQVPQGAKHSTANLNKISGMYRTPSQQRESERSSK